MAKKAAKAAAKPRTPRAAKPAAPATRAQASDEGESQSNYLFPSEGGSYVRNKDGSLTRTHGPTESADMTASDDNAKPKAAKRGRGAKAAAVEQQAPEPPVMPAVDPQPAAADPKAKE